MKTLILSMILGGFVTGCVGEPPCAGFDGTCVDVGTGAEAIDDPASCDDDNPCTADALCVPCDPRKEGQTFRDCTPPEEIPPFCEGHWGGCWHHPIARGAACFPTESSRDDGNPEAGVCAAGICVAD